MSLRLGVGERNWAAPRSVRVHRLDYRRGVEEVRVPVDVFDAGLRRVNLSVLDEVESGVNPDTEMLLCCSG